MGEDTYSIAVEPSTNRDAGRWDAKERRELLHLEAGQMRQYDLEIGAAVGEMASRSPKNSDLSGWVPATEAGPLVPVNHLRFGVAIRWAPPPEPHGVSARGLAAFDAPLVRCCQHLPLDRHSATF